MSFVRTDVAKQIVKDTGYNVGQFTANYLIKHYTRRWVSSSTIRSNIFDEHGYDLKQSQVSGTLLRLSQGKYRTDGLLEKHKTKQGVWRWVPDRDLVSSEPLEDDEDWFGVETPSIGVPEDPYPGRVLVEESPGTRVLVPEHQEPKRVIPQNPNRPLEVKYGKDSGGLTGHENDGISVVTSVVGGYLIKIDGHLYVARELKI